MTATSSTDATDQMNANAQRLRAVNERLLEAGRQAGNAYLDAYERTLKSIADLQDRTGRSTDVDWLSGIATAQADFTREVAQATASAGRELLK